MEKRGWAIFQWAAGVAAILMIIAMFVLTSEIQGQKLMMVHPTPWMYVLFGLSVIGVFLFVVGHLAKKREAFAINKSIILQAVLWTSLFYGLLLVINFY
ncbi:hypothetical protein [Pseudalkalibacillus salsuginis]|uniref:hypothetical protein n=1 Tax=Pseudalkalibacillus salsuginis TaxID=2910972 RepID=UPI001F3AFC7B|nr:hypothetical protein [Pseudalkalibacillus salsuginis]MCF6411558.1 hypothetical protein [Pseudalkalibacillus salsuginis]